MCENCTPTGKPCSYCGGDPCYHQCPNSQHYYSPEQERADDAFYGQDDVSERYAATAEPSQYADEPWDYVIADAETGTVIAQVTKRDITDDDIPF